MGNVGKSVSYTFYFCVLVIFVWFLFPHGNGCFGVSSSLSSSCESESNSYLLCRSGNSLFVSSSLWFILIFFPYLLFISIRLFLIWLLPNILGLLKSGFLTLYLCMLSRWTSWCDYGCSVGSLVGWVFLSLSRFYFKVHISDFLVGWLILLGGGFNIYFCFHFVVLISGGS